MKVTVVGTGYVGLVTAVCLAHIKHNVICLDIDQNKIDKLNKGISPIYEENIELLMKKNKKRLKYTTDINEAYKDSDIIFIGVPTPERKDGSANLDYVYEVSKQIATNITKDTIVVIKSTVPVGTNEKIEKYIIDNLKSDVKISVVSNPEFLSQGTAVNDTLHASRIVVGTNNEYAKNKMFELFKRLTKPPYSILYLSVDRKSAEMIKYASNTFLALKISYINEIANLCNLVDANIDEVTLGMSYDTRIGNKFLNPGCGYGGSCFPKDTKALYSLAKQYNYDLLTVKSCIDVNKHQKTILIDKARKKYKTFKGLNIAVLGLTFKPNTDDLREAPSLYNINILLEEKANVKAYDPIGIDNYKKIYKEIDYKNSIEETLKNTDICFIFTEWDEFKKLNQIDFIKNMKTPVIYDGRNLFHKDNMKNVEYYSIGR